MNVAGLLLLAALSFPALAAEKSAETAEALVRQATEAFKEHKRDEALALANQAVTISPTNFDVLFFRGRLLGALRNHDEAIKDFNRVLTLEPKAIAAYRERAQEHFKAGQAKESLADFDRFLELAPQQKPNSWQRGIACYYANKFEEGKKQFELHQTVNPNDVENAVWHYVCVAKLKGVEQAKASLIPIKEDSRVPMMEIYAL